MANVVAAISLMRCDSASCFQIGTPHCTRSLHHPRTISRHCLAMPVHAAGSVSRPVFSVINAIFKPLPSSPMRFSRGTRTSRNVITPLASAFRPMKRDRCSTLTPGQSVSTTKALIFLVCGSRAMTTSNSAIVPLVHHSFSPLST
jgi:hypothetical protein